jgi:hypothetical protein
MQIRTVALVVAVSCLAPGVSAQSRPDFSGTWAIDYARSKGISPANADTVIVVTQDAKTLTIEQKGVPKIVYHLDGTPAKNSRITRPGDVTYTSVWQGDRLVTTVTGGQPGQKEIRYLVDGEMVDWSELVSGVGPKFSRMLYWKKVKSTLRNQFVARTGLLVRGARRTSRSVRSTYERVGG